MIWSLDMDDFRGHCGSGRYPLVNAIRQELENYTVQFVYDGPYEKTAASLITGKAKAKDRKFLRISSLFPHHLILEKEIQYWLHLSAQCNFN